MNVVVLLLTADEVEELCLEREPALCGAAGIEFRSFPIDDRDVPSGVPDTPQQRAWALAVSQNLRG